MAAQQGEVGPCHTGPRAMKAAAVNGTGSRASVEVTFLMCAGLRLQLRNTTDFDLQISASPGESRAAWVRARVVSSTNISVVLAPLSPRLELAAAAAAGGITVSRAGTAAVNGVYTATKQAPMGSAWPVQPQSRALACAARTLHAIHVIGHSGVTQS